MGESIINSKESLEAYKKFLDAQFEQHKYIRATLKTGRQRSNKQNSSLNLFCPKLSVTLNDAGIDFRLFLRDGYAVPWTSELVKDHIWRPIQIAITGHYSTTKPTREQYIKIYDVLTVKLSEHGIFEPWPEKKDKK